MPDWAAQAKSKPLLESSGEALVAQLPDNPEGFLKQLRKPKDAPAEEPPPETDLPAQRRSDAGPTAPAPKR